MKQRTLRLTAAAALTAACFGAQAAATIILTSRDAPGVGFNDPTPVSPVGGNTGTTLGQQRINVYRYVADIWQAQLDSTVPIIVSAGWEALTCTAGSAVLGSASAWNIWSDFQNAPKAGTWYPQALANKIAGENLAADQEDDGTGYGNVDIKTQFNVNLGQANCLTGSPFYLGLDGKVPASQVNFVETLLHELGHGLGFSVLTVSTSTGSRFLGLPSVWEEFMFDNTIGKSWLQMTNAERKASALNTFNLAWTGPNAVAGAALTLGGTPTVAMITAVPGVSGSYPFGTASFGTPVGAPPVKGALALGPGIACDPTVFTPDQKAAVAGKIALVDRGTCTFVVKVKNMQDLGAIAVVVADNDPANSPNAPPALGGADATITIPSIRVSQQTGVTLKAAIPAAVKYGTRSKPGTVVASFGIDLSKRAGADAAGRPLLYTPSTLAPGSSVSHWDVSAFPNLLMEPNINSDLTTVLVPPKDLTFPLLQDLGW